MYWLKENKLLKLILPLSFYFLMQLLENSKRNTGPLYSSGPRAGLGGVHADLGSGGYASHLRTSERVKGHPALLSRTRAQLWRKYDVFLRRHGSSPREPTFYILMHACWGHCR